MHHRSDVDNGSIVAVVMGQGRCYKFALDRGSAVANRLEKRKGGSREVSVPGCGWRILTDSFSACILWWSGGNDRVWITVIRVDGDDIVVPLSE